MLKYACYSEHLHYKRKHWRESYRRIRTSHLCQSLFEHHPYNHLGCSDTRETAKEWSGRKGKSFSPTARWFWQLSYSNFHRVAVFSLQASLHIITKNKLLLTNTQVTTQPQSMTRAKPCPEYAAHIAQLHNLKPTLLFRAGPAAEPPRPQRGDQSFMPLHALPFWMVSCLYNPGSGQFLWDIHAAWLYQLSYQRDGEVRR